MKPSLSTKDTATLTAGCADYAAGTRAVPAPTPQAPSSIPTKPITTKPTRTASKAAAAPEPLTYADALAQATTLLEPRRTELGNAYPAALALTCAAIEHGHNANGQRRQ